jgi:hypothetical protein
MIAVVNIAAAAVATRGAQELGMRGERAGEGGAHRCAARAPTLWLYAKNDSYFGPELAAKMAAAWKEGGGASTTIHAASAQMVMRSLCPCRMGRGQSLDQFLADELWGGEELQVAQGPDRGLLLNLHLRWRLMSGSRCRGTVSLPAVHDLGWLLLVGMPLRQCTSACTLCRRRPNTWATGSRRAPNEKQCSERCGASYKL